MMKRIGWVLVAASYIVLIAALASPFGRLESGKPPYSGFEAVIMGLVVLKYVLHVDRDSLAGISWFIVYDIPTILVLSSAFVAASSKRLLRLIFSFFIILFGILILILTVNLSISEYGVRALAVSQYLAGIGVLFISCRPNRKLA